MLRHEMVDGRPATVAYLRGAMQPCAPDEADRIKVMFVDGDVIWLTGPKTQGAVAKVYNEDEHPRDEDGRWTDGGGGGGGGGSDAARLSDAPLGPDYSKHASLKNGVIHTSNVHDAARALMENRAVELKQPRQVATLIAYLGRMSKHMIAAGEKAPTFNLCNVSVKDTNLFCAQSQGIPRIKMPQLDDQQTKEFRHYLEGKGYAVEKTKERSDHLRATQNALDGAKVAKIAKKMRDDPEMDKRLVISRDNYILDGHHHWAAQIGIDAQDNQLGDVETKVSRVDIGIIELLHEAEVFTHGKGHKKLYNEDDHPRDENGRWTDAGGGDEGGVYDEATATAQDQPRGTDIGQKLAADDAARAVVAKLSEFSKAGIALGEGVRATPAHVDQFVKEWDQHIKETPQQFRASFLGGVPVAFKIDRQMGGRWDMSGMVLSSDGKDQKIGNFSFDIDWQAKTLNSGYLSINHAYTGKGYGKKLLGAMFALSAKTGMDHVKIQANIDVGGYAWAKYGFVPTVTSWASLSGDLLRKIDRGYSGGRSSGGSDRYHPESWEELGTDNQESIKEHWIEDTRQEFLESEEQNWRDNGEALHVAKVELATKFSDTALTDSARELDWAKEAILQLQNDRATNGQPNIPYLASQIVDALTIKYDDDDYDGKADPTIEFDDAELREPVDAPSPEQMTLPGVEMPDLSSHLTSDMRDEIETALVEAFNEKAEHDQDDVSPPDYLSDNVAEYQDESWDGMRDRDKYDYGERNGLIDDQEIERDDQDTEVSPDATVVDAEKEAVRTILESTDPKAIWALADSASGKSLLLNSSWDAVLNFKDKEAMQRFFAYVGKEAKVAA